MLLSYNSYRRADKRQFDQLNRRELDYAGRFQRNLDVSISKEVSFAGHEPIEILRWFNSYVRACLQENVLEGIAMNLASNWLTGPALTQWELYFDSPTLEGLVLGRKRSTINCALTARIEYLTKNILMCRKCGRNKQNRSANSTTG